MESPIREALEALAKGEASVDETIGFIEGYEEEEINARVGLISALDAYAQAALAVVDGFSDPNEIAERAFAIARACMVERVRTALAISADLGDGDDEDDDDDEDDGGGHAPH